MKKSIALICMLLAVLVLASGCTLIGHDDELDGAQVAATVNGKDITKKEWLEYRDYLVSYYTQMYSQYGLSFTTTDEIMSELGEQAIQMAIENQVINDKMTELGIADLSEEENKEIEDSVDSTFDFYKLYMRYLNHPDVETVEEEQERLAEATPSEATEGEAAETTESEAKATITDAELDEMLTSELADMGYTSEYRDYMVQQQISSKKDEKLRAYIYEQNNVAVTDEEVQADYESKVAAQKETYDATPTQYASDAKNGTTIYYVPEGYRGVRNVLIKITDEDQTAIDEINTAISNAQTAKDAAQSQLDEANAEDTSEYTEEALADRTNTIEQLNATIAEQQAIIDENTAKMAEAQEKAYADIESKAQDALTQAKDGVSFDVLLDTFGEDTGMDSEPVKTQGYPVCEGLTVYEQAFQDAAMALAKVGDVSTELVKTSYGYHILEYTCDIPSGAVEMTDDMKQEIYDALLSDAQDAAYQAAVDQWVTEANPKTYPNVMK